ncbi:phospholipid carrier-dependent glycosyltransferase [Nocardiopsis sp. RSe5-2]|uniref:Polyprenol-phosphate-mannose--protein mannosyltransferase n=1 Tax=Nocardiopsis endophytica TaxID=3018445 RepID=A0ABT4TWU9_9ACTN|nr:phospholipid carrier-dependent glycosyltransferase [Nocardiopsis endophytica]MDA2809168.1 phospholipid carrier-dependent glycosyltransferase [Nocardiopsis endophytica]
MTTTAPPDAADPAPATAHAPARPQPPMPRPQWPGWAAAVALALFAGVLRFIRLGQPPEIYFDETYYAKDAFSLWRFGYEHETLDNADDLLAQGVPQIWSGGPDFVVHPPVGKWMIALGDQLWGLLPFGTSMTPEGWRVASAFIGALTVLIMVRVALRMTRSWLLAAAAGLLLALDGLHFTMSRLAMVDVFVTFWVLAAFACLLVDRDRMRDRLAASPGAAWLGVRWWRLAAGLCLGLAVGTKWNALFFMAAFGLLTVAWDYGARRSAGQSRGGGLRDLRLRWLLFDAIPAFVQTVVVGAVVYVASWAGWFASSGAYDRQWGAENAGAGVSRLPDQLEGPVNALRGLIHYHAQMMEFHSGLSEPHDYASQPWDWLIMRVPVAFFYDGESGGCGTEKCSTAILSIGTPALWWIGLVALAVMLGWWLTYRDWRAGAVLLCVAAGWLPWFAYPDRTMFVFYALPFLPFVVLAIVLMLGLAMGDGEKGAAYLPARRAMGGVLFGVVLLLVIANFAFLYPVLSAETIPYDQWAQRMWFDTWIFGSGGGSG